jgi:hypothetical protein
LGGSTSTFAAPFVCRFDEPGSLKGTPKTGFVQALTQQQLVHLLELAQGECRRQKSERNRGLIEPSLYRPRCTFDDGTLPG